jgi:hypothetical protein
MNDFYKVNGHDSVTRLKHTPMFEWYVVGCVSKNIHQKYVCLPKIGFISSKFVNHCRLNIQHNRVGPIHYFNKNKLYTQNLQYFS